MWDRPFLDGASWVGPTWSISAEWLAYLLFPLTALVFFRLRRLPATVLGLGALAATAPMAVSFLVLGSPYYPFSWLVRILCGFSAGVLTLLAVRRLAGSARARRIAPTAATLAVLGIVGGLLAGDAAGGGLLGLVVLLFPVLVGALALTDRGPARWLGTRPMVHGGRISYALYLIHIPMFEIFWTALRHGAGGRFGGLLAPGSMSAHVAALVVLVATVPAAHLLYTLVEQPARGWMRALPGAWSRGAVAATVPEQATSVDADGPVDNIRARLDPPTLRVAPGAEPRRAAVPDRIDLPSPVPRQSGPADPVPALARLHTARAAGHGDDHRGDRLAGNLMAAARLRSTGSAPDAPALDRSDLVRRTVEATVPTARPVPAPSETAGSTPDATAPSEGVPEPRTGRSGSRTGAERCARNRHRAHGSAATPIVAAAAAATRGRRRPAHGLPPRQS